MFLQAVRDGISTATGGAIPAEYFYAQFETIEEAKARHAIYQAHQKLNTKAAADVEQQ